MREFEADRVNFYFTYAALNGYSVGHRTVETICFLDTVPKAFTDYEEHIGDMIYFTLYDEAGNYAAEASAMLM